MRKSGDLVRAAVLRWAGYLGVWVALSGPDPVALFVGLLASAAATWVSLRLLPPAGGRLRLGGVLRLTIHFLWQSLVAGLDVTRRAFHPSLPLRPGFLVYPVRATTETARSAFGALTSLMPGTLPVGTERDGALIYHCLDLDQPVAASLDRDASLFARTRDAGTSDE